MEIPDSLNINALPYITTYQLHRLLDGNQKLVNVAQLKTKRIKQGNKEEAFQLGLAYTIYRLIEQYNNKEES